MLRREASEWIIASIYVLILLLSNYLDPRKWRHIAINGIFEYSLAENVMGPLLWIRQKNGLSLE